MQDQQKRSMRNVNLLADEELPTHYLRGVCTPTPVHHPLATNLPESLLRFDAMVVMRPEFWKRVRSADGSAGGAWD